MLEVEIDAEIDSKGDPVCSDCNNLNALRKHHRSILEHIQHRLGAGVVTKTYAIENSWTMKVGDTISTLHRLMEGSGEAVVEKGREEERTEESLVSDYFMFSSIEMERRLLDETRGKWIARRTEMITKETERELGVEYRVNKQAVEKKPGTKSPEVKEMLGWEPDCMELLLLYEVRRWEELFSNKFKGFLDKIGNDRVEEKERLTREWRANRWKRLSPQMHAAEKRMADVDYMENKNGRLEIVRDQWAISINQIFERVDDPIMSLSNLRILIGGEDKERRLRFENEIEDTEFCLKRGTVLGRFDQFWDDDALFRCRYSRSKWLDFYQGSTVPL